VLFSIVLAGYNWVILKDEVSGWCNLYKDELAVKPDGKTKKCKDELCKSKLLIKAINEEAVLQYLHTKFDTGVSYINKEDLREVS